MTDMRLSDAIVAAHKISCEEDKREIALLLIEALELELTRFGDHTEDRRKKTELVETAFDLHEKTYGPLSSIDVKTGL